MFLLSFFNVLFHSYYISFFVASLLSNPLFVLPFSLFHFTCFLLLFLSCAFVSEALLILLLFPLCLYDFSFNLLYLFPSAAVFVILSLPYTLYILQLPSLKSIHIFLLLSPPHSPFSLTLSNSLFLFTASSNATFLFFRSFFILFVFFSLYLFLSHIFSRGSGFCRNYPSFFSLCLFFLWL